MRESVDDIIALEGAVEVHASSSSPEWMRRGDVRRVFAVGHDVLDDWAAEGTVEAHKLHPGRNGTVIYSVEDIRRAIRQSPIYLAVKREVLKGQTK